MGRRRKRNLNDDDDDDDDDRIEREYELKRQKQLLLFDTSTSNSGTRTRNERNNDNNHEDKKCTTSNTAKKDEQKLPSSSSSSTTTTLKNCSSTSNDKIEKSRLKKQKKRQLQKLKQQQKLEQQQQIQNDISKQNEEIQNSKKKKQSEKKILNDIIQEKVKSNTFKFITTHRGVQYCDIIVGKGPIIQDRKKVHVKYVLRANKHKTGKILDSSSNFSFRVGKGEVIPGWDIGLLRMRQGGVRYLIVPPGAGYGNRNIGAGPGGLLYFEITLLSC